MKQKFISIFIIAALILASPWKVFASTIHYMGTVTIYVDEEKTFYRSYIPTNYYVNADSWFLRQTNGNAWSDGQKFYDAKIVSKDSESCTIIGLAHNEDPYNLSSTELHCKGTRQSIGEYEEMYWKIIVKSYGYLEVDASPAGGTVDVGTKVTLTAKCQGSSVSGCDIFYTLDGTTPSKSSTKYTSSGITLNQSCRLKAKAYKSGYETYDEGEWYYTIVKPGIKIDATNFPDKNFRDYLLSRSYGSDGELTEEEIRKATYIDVNSQDISSLKGIELFSSLETLRCHKNKLTELDVSKNTALTTLFCYENQLTALDLSKNTALTYLSCFSNQLTALDLSNCTGLTSLSCYENQLTALDLSNCTGLTSLSCYENQLTALDLSKNTALTSLNCGSNQLTALDVSNCAALTYLYCRQNQLTALDVSNCAALTDLYCYQNQLTALDVSKNTALTDLSCYQNQLTALDVSKNTALTDLSCYQNQLTTLDVSKNTALTDLSCYQNQLTALDVSKNTALTFLNCSYNQLSALNVSKNTAMTKFYCYLNELTLLDVSKNIALEELNCCGNLLTSLDVSANKALKRLVIHWNKIKGSAMDALIDNLPTNDSNEKYTFTVLSALNTHIEENVCTKSQVAAAIAKGWTVRWHNGTEWVDGYEGSDDDPNPIIKGDLNGDGSVSITDVVLIIDVIAGLITDALQVEAADVNDDGNVTITDCVAAIDLIAAQQHNMARMAKAPSKSVNHDFISGSMQENTLTINLDNENHYTAFQMIVNMPDGMALEKASIDGVRGKDHQLMVRHLGNGQYLVAGFSMGNNELTGKSGRLLTIATNGQAVGDIIISHVEFATTDAESCRMEGIAVSATTGIEQVESRTCSSDDVPVFDLKGRRVSNPTRGLYIVNGKKMYVK